MNKTFSLELESLLLSQLKGKMPLLLVDEERRIVAHNALEDILKNDTEGQYTPHFSGEAEKSQFIKSFLSYGVLEEILCDEQVEDVVINALKPIYVHHSSKGFFCTGKKFAIRKELDVFIEKLVVFSGRHGYNKIANLELANLAGRVNIVDSPLGPQITITKAKTDPISIIDLIKNGSMTYEVAGQLWLYMEGLSLRPANVIIAGGPGTGKTTLLNALLAFIPPKDRLVVIEDTLELNTFLEDSCSPLETDEGLTLSDLVRNSLRMRPERVIVGEVRGEEARTLFTAMDNGHAGCLGTIHANNSREAIVKLQEKPFLVPQSMLPLLDLIVVLQRKYTKGGGLKRTVTEVAEVSRMENKVLLGNIYDLDEIEGIAKRTNVPSHLIETLASEMGITKNDFKKELDTRRLILEWMIEKEVKKPLDVLEVIQTYYYNPSSVLDMVSRRINDNKN